VEQRQAGGKDREAKGPSSATLDPPRPADPQDGIDEGEKGVRSRLGAEVEEGQPGKDQQRAPHPAPVVDGTCLPHHPRDEREREDRRQPHDQCAEHRALLPAHKHEEEMAEQVVEGRSGVHHQC
jgi:hypothetical protein